MIINNLETPLPHRFFRTRSQVPEANVHDTGIDSILQGVTDYDGPKVQTILSFLFSPDSFVFSPISFLCSAKSFVSSPKCGTYIFGFMAPLTFGTMEF